MTQQFKGQGIKYLQAAEEPTGQGWRPHCRPPNGPDGLGQSVLGRLADAVAGRSGRALPAEHYRCLGQPVSPLVRVLAESPCWATLPKGICAS